MKIDFSSPQWLAIAAHLESELARLRAVNDSVALPLDQTNALRGEIRLCKKLLALPAAADRDASVVLAD